MKMKITNKILTQLRKGTSDLQLRISRPESCIYLLGVIGLISPLLNVEASEEYSPFLNSLFGFDNWQQFFFAIGWPICTLVLGTLLLLISKYITHEGIKKSVIILSCGVFVLSFFYLVWTMHPTIEDFEKSHYRLTSIILGLILTFGYKSLLEALQPSNAKYKIYFKKIMNFLIIDVKNDHIHESKHGDYVKAYTKKIEEL